MFGFLEAFKVNYKSQNRVISRIIMVYIRGTFHDPLLNSHKSQEDRHTAYLRSLTQPCVCGVQCPFHPNRFCASLETSQQLSDFSKGKDL